MSKNETNDFAAFAILVNALGGGGNKGQIMPEDDVIDIASGATYIPYEVTDARRLGEKVLYFSQEKFWRMPDGTELR